VFACRIRNGRFRPSSEVAEIGWFEPGRPPSVTSARHRRVLGLVAAGHRATLFT
jgi:hypothetical protein